LPTKGREAGAVTQIGTEGQNGFTIGVKNRAAGGKETNPGGGFRTLGWSGDLLLKDAKEESPRKPLKRHGGEEVR